jgi:hypothetical protein
MSLGHHRVFQKRTQIAQITLMAQRDSIPGLSHLRDLRNQRICVGFWSSRDA